MNAGTLAKLLRMNPQNTERLNQAWGQAQKAASGVNNINDARRVVNAFGITNEAILRAETLLNSPVADIVASALGADIGKARKALNMLIGKDMQKPTNNNDDIFRLRAGLQQLKG